MEKIQYEDKFNIIIIGDGLVGKTSILERYFNDIFIHNTKRTLGNKKTKKGVDFFKKSLTIKGKHYLFKVWDTAGQEKYRSMSKNFLNKAHGLILTCSLTDRESFQHLRSWLNSVRECVDMSVVKTILVGNKCDSIDERVVTQKELQTKADELGLPYFETSALNNINIKEAFDCIFENVFESVYKREGGISLNKDEGNSTSNGCSC